MKNITILCFLFFSTNAFSQDTIYFTKDYRETTDTTNADFYSVKIKNLDSPDAGFQRAYWMSGKLKLEEYFSSFKERTLEGKRTKWRRDGSLWVESNYQNGNLDGPMISYWKDGRVKREDLYRNGKLIQGKVYDLAGNEVEWYPMEVRPVFPGGKKGLIKYLKNNTHKPKGVAGGSVLLEFIIDVDGSVTDVRIIESTLPALNLAAYNVVANMPDWKPGEQDGKPIRVNLTLPLTFR